MLYIYIYIYYLLKLFLRIPKQQRWKGRPCESLWSCRRVMSETEFKCMYFLHYFYFCFGEVLYQNECMHNNSNQMKFRFLKSTFCSSIFICGEFIFHLIKIFFFKNQKHQQRNFNFFLGGEIWPRFYKLRKKFKNC